MELQLAATQSVAVELLANGSTTPAALNDSVADWQMPFSPPMTGFLGFLAAITSFITVVGNLLVITAFFVERQLRSATNYFIASLAITDLLIGMFSMNLYTLYLLLGKWPLGRIICDLWLSLDYTACLTSQYTVFCITVDRFCSVKIPAKYRKWRSETKVRVMVAATWVLPAMLFAPPIFAWPYVAQSTRHNSECYAEFTGDAVYNTILTICYFWVTLFVMIALYIGIYRVALKLARKSEAKRRKVNNLMTMANQTAKVGLGVTNAQRSSSHEEEQSKSPQRPLVSKTADKEAKVRQVKKARAADRKAYKKESKKMKLAHSQSTSYRSGASSEFNSTSRADDERSSSPALPSDSDNPPEAAANHKPGEPNLSTIHSPVLVESGGRQAPAQRLTASNDSDYHTASCLSYENAAMEVNGVGVGVHFAVPLQRVCQEPKLQYSLCAPSDEFEGLRYIDEDSIRSNPSIDSMRLLIDLLPRHAAFAKDCAGSPVWKRRQSFVFPEDSGATVQTRVDLDTVEHDRIVTSVVEVSPEETIESGPDNESTRKAVNLRTIADSLRDMTRQLRRRVRNKRLSVDNKQSRTENRARKALKTITLILGAFVACWTPFHVLVMIRSFCDKSCINDHLYSFSYWLCYMNSPINPFCYALANAQFKKTFLRIIRFDLRRR